MPKLITWARPSKCTSKRCRSRHKNGTLISINTPLYASICVFTLLKLAKVAAWAAVNSSGSIIRCSRLDKLRNSTPNTTPIKIIRAKSRPPCLSNRLNSSNEPPSIAANSSENLPNGASCA